MEWKKTSISGAELERQQQAYIKEALEMAKRSVTSQFGSSDKISADEKADFEKTAAEKAAAEKAAAEKAAAEKAAAEKAAAERAAENAPENNTTNICEENKEDDDLTQFSSIIEEETKCAAPKTASEEPIQSGEPDIIDIAQIKKENFTKESGQAQISSDPPNFNNYIDQHNKAQCNCPNCQRKRQQQ